ncbi:PepSY domain-containing protein [Paractinoplanes lichenicola]|uniref:PepSY domain-containing protein n=1 Tax=Paractinoplanes lichenicola TaxID=2802976 RepID=A0ABS1VX05_9ACTN|nr:PepSY domain-containing protein [Actinoplanes lichenicola]MBL7258873.1 PepSY domain-containing protein [Actinoplanes lichenicola]
MKRSYAIAAAVGAAAVLGVTGTALAAGGDDAGPSVSPSPTSSSEVFRGDGGLDDNSSPSSSPSPFETVEPGSVTPVPRSSSSSPSATSGLGNAAGGAVNSISIAQAKAKALSVVGGGRVTKVEAETEHGRAVWEVEVIFKGAEHDLDIDRKTGAVTDHDIDRDDDRGRGRGGDDDRNDDKGRGGDDDRSGRHGGDDDRHGDDNGGRHGDDNGGRHGDDD